MRPSIQPRGHSETENAGAWYARVGLIWVNRYSSPVTLPRKSKHGCPESPGVPLSALSTQPLHPISATMIGNPSNLGSRFSRYMIASGRRAKGRWYSTLGRSNRGRECSLQAGGARCGYNRAGPTRLHSAKNVSCKPSPLQLAQRILRQSLDKRISFWPFEPR